MRSSWLASKPRQVDMHTLLNKPLLWSYGEAAEILGLDPIHGRRTVTVLVKALDLKPKATGSAAKGLDRSDLEALARSLNRTIGREKTAAS